MKPTYFCGVIEDENGWKYICPMYRKLGPVAIWIGEEKSREVIDDFEDNFTNYNVETLHVDKSRVNKFGIIGFSRNPKAKLELPKRNLEELISMFDESVAQQATGPDMPRKWKMHFEGSAIIQEPRYKT